MRTDGGNVIYAKILRYISAQMADDEDEGELPEDLREIPATLEEIADAFEAAGGFHFEAHQAIALSHIFTLAEAGMRTLANQAADGGQSVAAAKLEWAADQAREMTTYLLDKQASGDGGTLVLPADD